MANYILENDLLRVEVSSFGAELQSIFNKVTKFEYIWCGDEAYWGRRSPILFPIVGKLWEGCMRYRGKSYNLTQHGFARDREFTPLSDVQLSNLFGDKIVDRDTICGFVLNSDETTLQIYPFDFALYVVYHLNGNELDVMWIVENNGTDDMYFQIGAHPAFNYREFDSEAEIQGYICFDKSGLLSQTQLECGGYASSIRSNLDVASIGIPITKDTFVGDAFVFEKQISSVSLCDKMGNPYVRVTFDAPVVGLWSPAKKGYAPFMCIEPWFGRCDDSFFTGEYNQKPYINYIPRGEKFNSIYTIELF